MKRSEEKVQKNKGGSDWVEEKRKGKLLLVL